MSKAACMFICKTQVFIPKLHRQTKEAEKLGYLEIFLCNLPLLQLLVHLHCHHFCQRKGIILVLILDKLKQHKWWLLLPAVRFGMCSFTGIEDQPSDGFSLPPPESQWCKLLPQAGDSTAQGQWQTRENRGLRHHTLWTWYSADPVIVIITQDLICFLFWIQGGTCCDKLGL